MKKVIFLIGLSLTMAGQAQAKLPKQNITNRTKAALSQMSTGQDLFLNNYAVSGDHKIPTIRIINGSDDEVTRRLLPLHSNTYPNASNQNAALRDLDIAKQSMANVGIDPSKVKIRLYKTRGKYVAVPISDVERIKSMFQDRSFGYATLEFPRGTNRNALKQVQRSLALHLNLIRQVAAVGNNVDVEKFRFKLNKATKPIIRVSAAERKDLVSKLAERLEKLGVSRIGPLKVLSAGALFAPFVASAKDLVSSTPELTVCVNGVSCSREEKTLRSVEAEVSTSASETAR